MRQCTAKSKRSRNQCLKWAVKGRSTCHMHGGTAKGPKSKEGKEKSRLAALKHGNCTQKAIAEDKKLRKLIRLSKNRLQQFEC